MQGGGVDEDRAGGERDEFPWRDPATSRPSTLYLVGAGFGALLLVVLVLTGAFRWLDAGLLGSSAVCTGTYLAQDRRRRRARRERAAQG